MGLDLSTMYQPGVPEEPEPIKVVDDDAPETELDGDEGANGSPQENMLTVVHYFCRRDRPGW